MLYTTNFVVYVFHNRKRVLAGKVTKKSSKGQRPRAGGFILDEAEVGITL